MSKQDDKKSGRTYGGMSMEQRKVARRQQFLDAGLEVFGTTGFRSATVRGLCRQAKLTDRYFYESYGSLEKLLVAVYEDRMTNLRARIVDVVTIALPNKSTEEVIHAGLDCFFNELEDPRVAKVCMVELEGVSPDVDELYHGYILGFAELILWMTRQLYPDVDLPDDEIEVIGISIVGAMRQSATHWLRGGYAIERQTMVEATAKLFVGLMTLVVKD
ncbi:hypothetical protein A9Q99_11830 [Gammaproteobacteria bacterium 45_16_T64]|nr:hypothetical protein A9Q99_11830 [Gammaproteobacteria bacterium 45_16_T64]